MDDILRTVILNLPNFGGLILALFWLKQLADKQHETIKKLAEELADCRKEKTPRE